MPRPKPKTRVRVDEQGEVIDAVVIVQPAAEKPFTWSAVPRKERRWLREVTEELTAIARTANENLVRSGRFLIDVKARLGHGLFLAWCAAEYRQSGRQARRLMAVAEAFGGAKLASLANIDQMALYALSAPSAPEKARERALEAAEKGERVTEERAAELVAAEKGDPVKRPSPPPGEDLYTERLDRAIGPVIKLHGDPYEPPAEEITFTYAELYRLQRILFRENYPDEPPPPEPTDAAPGSDAKIAALALRAAARQPLHAEGDAKPDDDHVLDAEPRSGGAGRVCEACGRRMPPPIRVRGWKVDGGKGKPK